MLQLIYSLSPHIDPERARDGRESKRGKNHSKTKLLVSEIANTLKKRPIDKGYKARQRRNKGSNKVEYEREIEIERGGKYYKGEGEALITSEVRFLFER